MIEGVLRLRLVADIAPGAAWATLQPAAGGDPGTTRPGRGAVATLPPSIHSGSCQAMRPAGRTWWRRSGAHRGPGFDQGHRSTKGEGGLAGG